MRSTSDQLKKGTGLPIILAVAFLVLPGAERAVRAAPPPGAAWKLAFHDEFERDELDPEKWWHAMDAPASHESSRWPENVEVKDGVCRLVTRKQRRGKTDWTTARFYSRSFYQKYGYFEARVKVIGRTGVNNGFWITSIWGSDQWRFLQIDAVAVHGGGKQRPMIRGNRSPDNQGYDQHVEWTPPVDLSKDFHVYGLLWTEKAVVWYFDGREIYRISEPFDPGPMRVEFGTAVGAWAGEVTDALDGTAMEVDYVRAFEKVQRLPAWPEVLDGVQ